MTHASLFSGIGGFDLAAQWAGWTNLFSCEINPFCQTVLKHHFPNATQYSDIRATDFTVWRGQVDVLTGGFPCQPFSVAGKRKGTDDTRYLWPEMLRAIREISPRFVVGENVRGIINWSAGMVFEQVCADLEALGYEVTPFLIPAVAVNAPHRRDRVWFIAHRTDARAQSVQQRQDGVYKLGIAADTQRRRGREMDDEIQSRQSDGARLDSASGKRLIADTDNPRSNTSSNANIKDWATVSAEREYSLNRARGFSKIGATVDTSSQQSKRMRSAKHKTCRQKQREFRRGHSANCRQFNGKTHWQNFPTQSPVCRRDDGLSDWLDFNAVFAGIQRSKRARAFPRWRSEAIKGCGNAVVPQIPYIFFKIINQLCHT